LGRTVKPTSAFELVEPTLPTRFAVPELAGEILSVALGVSSVLVMVDIDIEEPGRMIRLKGIDSSAIVLSFLSKGF
jgi:hypothetical protein